MSGAKRVGVQAATMVLALAIPPAALAAEGAKVLDCIRAVSKASWASFEVREALAAVACQGIRDFDADSKEFKEKVAVLGNCFKKVSSRSRVRGTEAELVAANACIGATSADETVACMDKVERSFRTATDAAAEVLAATACSRANPAAETAACVRTVSFRLTSSGILADTLAAIACGR
jgi:hypothetical protein